MAWIHTPKLPPDHPALVAARKGLPAEYRATPSDLVPAAVRAESIVASHTLAPDVMAGMFSGFVAMMSPDLPLSRREHEMIAVVVSKLNDCFY
jgi:hypothetical protein